MNANSGLRWLLGAMVAGSAAGCALPASAVLPARVDPSAVAPLGPGDQWHGITLSTGEENALSLWAVCRPAAEGSGSAEVDCRVPTGPLAIGPSATALPELVSSAEWEWLRWSLSLNGRPVDLEAFGSTDFLWPRKAQHGREAFFTFRAWNVVLAQAEPGEHVLQVAVTQMSHPGKEVGTLKTTTQWVIHLIVEAAAVEG